MATETTPTAADSLDMFAELPRRVQVAVLSHIHSMRSRGRIDFHEYPLLVAQYIEASGLMNVRYSRIGNDYGASFSANEQTAVIKANLRTCLEMTGIKV